MRRAKAAPSPPRAQKSTKWRPRRAAPLGSRRHGAPPQVNNFFSVFSCKAQADHFAVDGVEVADARWFERKELLRLWKQHGSQGVDEYRQELPGLPDPKGRTMVSSWALCCLHAFEGGGGVQVQEIRRTGKALADVPGAVKLHYLAVPTGASAPAQSAQ